MKHNARHVSARGRCEVKAGVGHIIRLAETTERGLTDQRRLVLFGKILCHVGVDEARCDAVDSDAPRTDFPRERHRHADQTGLGGRIVHLTGIAHRPHDRGHGNDAARALLHHRANTGARQAEGCGQIGFMTAKLFQAFGAEVYAYARHEREEVKAAGIAYKPLDDLLRECDIISLHTPNNKETRGMISAEKIALMKKPAIFINCARGPIVDSKALAQALNEGRIAGAAVDVFDCEPPIPAEEPLLHPKNTLLTPHVAFLSEEAMVRRAKIEFSNVYAYLDGKPENVCAL